MLGVNQVHHSPKVTHFPPNARTPPRPSCKKGAANSSRHPPCGDREALAAPPAYTMIIYLKASGKPTFPFT